MMRSLAALVRLLVLLLLLFSWCCWTDGNGELTMALRNGCSSLCILLLFLRFPVGCCFAYTCSWSAGETGFLQSSLSALAFCSLASLFCFRFSSLPLLRSSLPLYFPPFTAIFFRSKLSPSSSFPALSPLFKNSSPSFQKLSPLF